MNSTALSKKKIVKSTDYPLSHNVLPMNTHSPSPLTDPSLPTVLFSSSAASQPPRRPCPSCTWTSSTPWWSLLLRWPASVAVVRSPHSAKRRVNQQQQQQQQQKKGRVWHVFSVYLFFFVLQKFNQKMGEHFVKADTFQLCFGETFMFVSLFSLILIRVEEQTLTT